MSKTSSKKSEIYGKHDFGYTDPGAVGLAGFGISTTFLMIHNIGLIGLDSAVLSNAIIFGGIAQVLAGIMEFRRKNTFGLLAFTSYGMFWISFGLLILFPMFYTDGLSSPNTLAMGFYVFVWGLFTAGMFLYTLVTVPFIALIQVIFCLLMLVFFGLAIVDWLAYAGRETDANLYKIIVGIGGVLLGLLAFLNSGIKLINASLVKRGRKPINEFVKICDFSELLKKNGGDEMEREGEYESLGQEDSIDSDDAIGEDFMLDFNEDDMLKDDGNTIVS